MRIYVDPGKCQGHSRCYALAPDLYDVDDFGLSTARNGGLVPEDRIKTALLTIANCPERAIHVVDEPASQAGQS
jgi:ferredoxin